MAPWTPWTDCHKLILANQNPWQNRLLTRSPLPRIANKEKLTKEYKCKSCWIFFKALTRSARELHLHLTWCMQLHIHTLCRAKVFFFIPQLLINISSSVIHSVYKHLLSAYCKFCSMLDSGDNEMRCPFGRLAGRPKVISKTTTTVYLRGTESLRQ